MTKPIVKRNQNGRGRRRGSVMVEFAVMSPVLLMLLGGTMDFARLFHQSMALSNAARMGAQYAMGKDSNMHDYPAIEQVTRDAQPGMTGITATATLVCRLAPVDATTQGDGPTVPCGSLSGYTRQYLEVTATKSYTLYSTYLALPSNFPLVGKAVVRLQ